IVMATNDRQGITLNMVVGIVGAIWVGWFLSGLFGTSTINQGSFSLSGAIVSLLGAIILLAKVRLARGAVTQ
ncbi:MAG: GlsB/YeaQ/YmgE family stress response membrane protein, partial [Steroidobacteraceae bacterium]